MQAGNQQINSLSCPTKSFCVGVENDEYADIWNGFRWTRTPELLPYTGQFKAVSCASPRFCVAVDADGNIVFGRFA